VRRPAQARSISNGSVVTLDATIAAWDAEAPTFERGLRELGYEIGSHFVGNPST
jgi:hypothetical protein